MGLISDLAVAPAVDNAAQIPVEVGGHTRRASRAQLLQADAGEPLDLVAGGVWIELDPAGLLVIKSTGPTPETIATFDVANKVLRIENAVQLKLVKPDGTPFSALECDAAGKVKLGFNSPDALDVYLGITDPATFGGSVHLQSKGIDRILINASGQLVLSGGGTGSRIRLTGAVALEAPLRTNQNASATTPGSIVAKLPIYSTGGIQIGDIPIYDAIT